MRGHSITKNLLRLISAFAMMAGATATAQETTESARKKDSIQDKKIEDRVYAYLKEHGEINHPSIPLIVRVKRVQGRKLQFLQFIRRSNEGVGFDFVGNAMEAEISVDSVEGELEVTTRYFSAQRGHGHDALLCVERAFSLSLPADLSFLEKKPVQPFAKVHGQLPRADREFLREGFDGGMVMKVVKAFGPDCKELLLHWRDVPCRKLLVGFEGEEPRPAPNGRVELPSCTLIQFGEKKGKHDEVGPVLHKISGKCATISKEDYLKLRSDSLGPKDHVTFEFRDGRRITIGAVDRY